MGVVWIGLLDWMVGYLVFCCWNATQTSAFVFDIVTTSAFLQPPIAEIIQEKHRLRSNVEPSYTIPLRLGFHPNFISTTCSHEFSAFADHHSIIISSTNRRFQHLHTTTPSPLPSQHQHHFPHWHTTISCTTAFIPTPAFPPTPRSVNTRITSTPNLNSTS